MVFKSASEELLPRAGSAALQTQTLSLVEPDAWLQWDFQLPPTSAPNSETNQGTEGILLPLYLYHSNRCTASKM